MDGWMDGWMVRDGFWGVVFFFGGFFHREAEAERRVEWVWVNDQFGG
jgi:hypothetical protein